MKLVLKRIGAYIIDTLIVLIISTLLSNIRAINYQLDKYTDYYDLIIETSKKYEKGEMTDKQFKKENLNLSYEIEKNSTITSIISLACIIGYFGIFQYSRNGKTIGKKIFKLQVIKNSEGNLNIKNYLIRCLILNNAIFIILRLILISTLNKNTYINSYTYTSSIQVILQLSIIVSILISKNQRGIHDYIAGTKVIDLKLANKSSNNKIIEGEII